MNRNPENEMEHCSPSFECEQCEETNATIDSAGIESGDHNDASASASQGKDSLSLIRAIFEYFELFVASLCIVFLVFMFGVRLCNVRGESMEKTLYAGERLLISDLFYEAERGDIVVFHQTGDYLNEPVVKRVIATGGETVVLDYRSNPQTIVVTVYNGDMTEVLDESTYAYYDGTKKSDYNNKTEQYRVPEGYLFVLGDNRNNSADSRSPAIGLVDERRVLGKVIVRVFPLSRFGAVD